MLLHAPVAAAPATGDGAAANPDGAAKPAYTAWDDIDIAERLAGQAGLLLQVTRHTLYASTCSYGHVTRAAHHVARAHP
ncbi:hypothetical protein [Pseudoduganella namucuonensis]|uniref:hypothetical protein n=1 Tax=Pseudoduganella namucuonensis TaxID=1035707 RepID=UPI0011607D4E|nr:hypothetical protein [Pseudoduganella namucuonensis]